MSELKPIGTECFTWHGNIVVSGRVTGHVADSEFFRYEVEIDSPTGRFKEKMFEPFWDREEARTQLDAMNRIMEKHARAV